MVSPIDVRQRDYIGCDAVIVRQYRDVRGQRCPGVVLGAPPEACSVHIRNADSSAESLHIGRFDAAMEFLVFGNMEDAVNVPLLSATRLLPRVLTCGGLMPAQQYARCNREGRSRLTC